MVQRERYRFTLADTMKETIVKLLDQWFRVEVEMDSKCGIARNLILIDHAQCDYICESCGQSIPQSWVSRVVRVVQPKIYTPDQGDEVMFFDHEEGRWVWPLTVQGRYAVTEDYSRMVSIEEREHQFCPYYEGVEYNDLSKEKTLW